MLTQVKPLRLPISNGNFKNNEVVLTTPVVLAPMAGITNAAFRRLCREQGAGLFVSEMVTARALIERREETFRLIKTHLGVLPTPGLINLNILYVYHFYYTYYRTLIKLYQNLYYGYCYDLLKTAL